MPDSPFQSLPTPNPEEMAFRVRADAAGIFPSQIPKRLTPFKKCSELPVNKSRVMQQDLGDYVYTKFTVDGEYAWFYFIKNKTDEELEEFWDQSVFTDTHSWLPILQDLRITEDETLPLSTTVVRNGAEGIVSGPRYYVNENFIPDADEGSRIVVRKFYGPRHHQIPQHIAPLGTAVSYDLPGGVSGRFPKCLHPDIRVDPARTGTELLVGDAASPVSGQLDGQVFPKTNFIRWAPYVFADREYDADELGGYSRTQMIAIPPPIPKRILKRN